MLVKDIITTDFVNYKKPSMYIAFPYCTFKCEKDCGIKCCQNSPLALQPNIEISIDRIIQMFDESRVFTKALVLCGMEPFESWNDVEELISKFRENHDEDIVIYTGFYEEEIQDKVDILRNWPNIIIKFGRFVPNKEHHKDELLGVELASPNQFAKKIS